MLTAKRNPMNPSTPTAIKNLKIPLFIIIFCSVVFGALSPRLFKPLGSALSYYLSDGVESASKTTEFDLSFAIDVDHDRPPIISVFPSTTNKSRRRTRERVIFGHLHMAKTSGTTINGMLAHSYERVCGIKGFSYDAHQTNVRHKAAGGGGVFRLPKDRYTNDPRKHWEDIMDEIGYEDCDFISIEENWKQWPHILDIFRIYNMSLELHVPCRSPLDHLMSMCNHQGKKFNCNGGSKIEDEVKKCVLDGLTSRFSKELLKVDNMTVHCFASTPPNNYIEYMGNILQKKRVDGGEFVHRSTNDPRNKSNECIWDAHNSRLRDEVQQILMNYEYYSWCQACLGSDRDLLYIPKNY